ncbi:MAG: acetate--CoA ligase family protein [Hyphomicrobium sp.]|uniref:acetate--CoA ligase family protein n=1 Tax=Hyphomicrobium sp. TaxID=82 RepID=UPI003D0B3DAD
MNLERLLRPKRVAILGGSWVDPIAPQCRNLGFAGEIWRVHPTRPSGPGERYYRSLAELPAVPDCVAVGVSRELTVAAMPELVAAGVGGAVCFASGFAEAPEAGGRELSEALLEAAGDMPFLGPNCYGFINYFDRVGLWPDQIGGEPVDRGVALICQSGAISFTLMSQQRQLPIGYLITIGNQARIQIHHLIRSLLEDGRVSAIGLYVEGVSDLAAFQAAAEAARAKGVPIALIKSGRSAAAAKAAASHTASLSGADRLYDALFRRLGIARCDSLAELVETLKLLHVHGPLATPRVLVTGCSGGDMGMTADLADGLPLDLAPIPEPVKDDLVKVLGTRVALDNPFDFQTFIWFKRERLEAMFRALSAGGYSALGFVVDHPDPDYCDIAHYEVPLRVFVETARAAGQPAAVITSLPEALPKRIRRYCMARGVPPLQGLPEALRALAHAAAIRTAWDDAAPLRLLPGPAEAAPSQSLSEAEAKAELAKAGIAVPRGWHGPAAEAATASAGLAFPLIAKTSSPTILHKTEVGGVRPNLRDEKAVAAAAVALRSLAPNVLVEEMAQDIVAELLLGVSVDRQFGPTLLLGAGGTLTELLREVRPLLFPVSEAQVMAALRSLAVWPLLQGFRGRPVGDVDAAVETVLALARYVEANAANILELEINPLMVRPRGRGALAGDALLRLAR